MNLVLRILLETTNVELRETVNDIQTQKLCVKVSKLSGNVVFD